MDVVRPAPHEFTANFVFDENGLDPFFGADARVKAGNGSQTGRFKLDGKQWITTLWYSESNLLPPDGRETPSGTTWTLEVMREFHLTIRRAEAEDPVGKQAISTHIAPRWQGMRGKKQDGTVTETPVPADIEEGVNVRMSGSNVSFDRYHDLLRRAADAVKLNPWYFRNPHPFSNVQDAARYVRVHTDRSGPIHARDGPIAQMAHLLEDDRSGYRDLMQRDENLRGERLPGFMHKTTLGHKRVREAFPDHTFPREVKHYYAREALSFSKDEALRHPKVEIAYQASKWREKIGVDELAELGRQLDQTLYSVLGDAGVQVHVGERDPFFPDAYFEPNNVDRPRKWLYDMDLTTIEHDQESVVLSYLADGLSPVDWENLSTLVTDGGDLSPADIAATNDRHVDSVRRSLRRMEDLLDREYGHVRLRSPFVAELIHKKITIAREAARDAADATAKVAHAAERELDEQTSAFISWAAAVGADVDDSREARMVLRMNELEESMSLRRFLREGYRLWVDAGKDEARFRQARVDLAGRGRTVAWRWL